MHGDTVARAAKLPSGRSILPQTLQAVCELLSELPGLALQPEEVLDGLEAALVSQQPADPTDTLQSIFTRACLALQQASARGWPDVVLFRSLINRLAVLVDNTSASTDEEFIEALASQADIRMGSMNMNHLLMYLWLFCQICMTLDQHHSASNSNMPDKQRKRTSKKVKSKHSCMTASDWNKERAHLLRKLSAVHQKLWLMPVDSHEELDRVAADKRY
ncbi:hypothetical protein WJX74_004131 [Apatococcus lobatus]|uniref:Uncharacterized protein n=1 Tax=Apatococcus lobatus TaxID=904363 RepID=A0AAW1QBY4_9CHLO